MLAPLTRRLGLQQQALSFSVNLQPPTDSAVVTERTDTVTVFLALTAGLGVHDQDVPSGERRPTTSDSTAVTPTVSQGRTSRWGTSSRWDHGAYRPLRPPTPPIPNASDDHVRRADRAFRRGLTFAVFDVHNHMRILPRQEGQVISELVEMALAQTPQIRRPWSFRVHLGRSPNSPADGMGGTPGWLPGFSYKACRCARSILHSSGTKRSNATSRDDSGRNVMRFLSATERASGQAYYGFFSQPSCRAAR